MSVPGRVLEVEAPDLLEREEQLGALGGALSEVAERGVGLVVLVHGEAGIGKTALVRRFCGQAGGSVRVLWATCDPLFTPRPLGPLFDIARVVEGELREQVEAGGQPHGVAGALMDELDGRSPSVVVIEDLHWADEATLDVLRVCARRINSVRALLVLTYRDDGLHPSHPLRSVLGELPSTMSARHELPRLSESAVAALARASTVDLGELYERTGGNPFFVTEVLAAGGGRIPPTVRDAVLARAAGLSGAARDVLEAVAVVPQRTEVWLLEALVQRALDGLDECLESGMLRGEADGVVFRHELARLAIEESLTPHRAVVLHRRALAALSDPTLGAPDYVRLAHHAEAAGDGSAMLRYAPAAGERAAERGSPREAQHHYWRALRFAEGIDPAARADLLERFCDHAYLSDMRSEAVGAIDEAIAIHRQRGDIAREGRALRMRSRLLSCIGRGREAVETIREAVRVLEQGPPDADLARAYSTLSGMAMIDYDIELTVTAGAKAIALAQEVDDAEGLVNALNMVGTAEMIFGNHGGQAKLERSLELARQAHLVIDAGTAYINLGLGLIHQWRWRDALVWVERGIGYTHELGLEAWMKCLVGERALVELALGRWDDAAATAQTILDGPHDQIIEPRTNALIALGLVRARRGDPSCWPLLDEAWERAVDADELQFLGPAAAARAEAAWLEGRTEAIGAETEAAYDLACRVNESTTAGWLGCWRARAGLPVEPPDDVPERFRLQIDGDFEAASELLKAEGADYDAAIALVASSDGPLVRAAHEQLLALGAKPAAAIVARRLRELGERNLPRGPRAATRENPAGLTNRELEVLLLLAQGLRNADIARRLVVTPKTVDHHVSSILRKLGVTSRGQASAAATRLAVIAADEDAAPVAK